MKHIISILLFLSVSLITYAQTWIQTQDAKQFRGELVNVVGYVSDIRSVSGTKLSGTYISLSGKDPSRSITLIVLPRDLDHFKILADNYLHNYVHVKGKIMVRKGKPYMFLSSQKQISVATEAPEIKTYEPL